MSKYVQYFPIGLLTLTIGKLLFLPNWETASSVLIAGIVVIAYEIKNRDKELQAFKQGYEERLKNFETKLELHSNVINNHAKAYEDMKTHVSGLNLARNLKPSAPTSIEKIF